MRDTRTEAVTAFTAAATGRRTLTLHPGYLQHEFLVRLSGAGTYSVQVSGDGTNWTNAPDLAGNPMADRTATAAFVIQGDWPVMSINVTANAGSANFDVVSHVRES